jgi:diamine N-acetyltransferase
MKIVEITRDNWEEALALGVRPEQLHFVAGHSPIVALALAKGYVRPAGLVWVPFGFDVAGRLVGSATLAYEPDAGDNFWLFHVFVDAAEQGKGHGTRALDLLIDLVLERFPECRAIRLTVHPENHGARRLYERRGFRPTGEVLWGEHAFRLELRHDTR